MIKHRVTVLFSHPTSSIHTREMKACLHTNFCSHVQSSTICNNQKVEIDQMPTNWQMDKESVIYVCIGILIQQ
jgi:hypothetical protein